MANINDRLMTNIYENNIDEILGSFRSPKLPGDSATREVIKLIKKGADVNYKNDLPLFHCIEENKYEMIKILIDMGADIDNKDGRLLLYSIGKNDYEITLSLFVMQSITNTGRLEKVRFVLFPNKTISGHGCRYQYQKRICPYLCM